MHVLNFSPNPYVLIPVVGIGIYSFLFYRIYFLRFQSPANRWFLIYLATSLAAGLMDFFGSLSTTAADATYWYLLFFVLNTYSFSALVGFALAFTERKKLAESTLVRVLLYLPATIVSCFLLFTDVVIVHNSAQTKMDHLMWHLTEGALRGPLYFGWIQLTVLGSIILFILYSRKVTDRGRRMQARLYAASLFVQVVVDIVILNIFPILLGIFIVPDGIVSVFFMGCILAYGILRFNLFTVSPSAIASMIVDTMNDSVVVLNKEGNIDYVNKAASDIFGYQPHDIIGKSIKILIGEELAEFENTIIQPVYKFEKVAKKRTSLTSRNGTRMPVQISASPIWDQGKIVGVVCVINDLTQLLQLRDVTTQRDTLSKIIEAFKDTVIAYDSKFNISICNSAGEAIIGKQLADLKGKSIWDMITLNDIDGKVNLDEMLKSPANTHAGIEKKNLHFVNQLGATTPVNLIVTPIENGAGLDLAGFIVLHDISKEKQLEDMKLDFVSIAAHELRTPITSIRGYLSLLLESEWQKKNSEDLGMLKRVDLSAQRLYALIDNLLSVSKIERGRITVHARAIDWLGLINQVVVELAHQASAKNITLKVTAPESALPQVSADPLLINEVVSNLITNAIVYTPTGGAITVSFQVENKSLITHISDTGEGIPADSQEHLFTKFYRVSKPLEQGSKGTGLGLYISKSIIDMHKGKIWVDSQPGKGSTFSFSLPLY